MNSTTADPCAGSGGTIIQAVQGPLYCKKDISNAIIFQDYAFDPRTSLKKSAAVTEKLERRNGVYNSQKAWHLKATKSAPRLLDARPGGAALASAPGEEG